MTLKASVNIIYFYFTCASADEGAGISRELGGDPAHSQSDRRAGNILPSGTQLNDSQPQRGGHAQHDAPAHAEHGGLQDSEWQGDEPISRRYLAADILDSEDEDMDEDAIPGTP